MADQLPPGEWTGFYLEFHRPERSWMNLFLQTENDEIKAEGTDYVGPWTAIGTFNPTTGDAHWVKQYVGKHQVIYQGRYLDGCISGTWQIGIVEGPFTIWPKSMAHWTELYLKKDLEVPQPRHNSGRYSLDIDEFSKNPL